MRARRGLLGFATFGAGAVTGALLEDLVYRRAFRPDDPESQERFGSTPGRSVYARSFDGTTIYARAYGPSGAPALVFAHGMMLDHRLWHYQVRELSSDRLCVAYDARGHGRSGPARGPGGTTPFDAAAIAHDLAAVVEAGTSGDVVLVGHSMGGMAVQAFFEHYHGSEIAKRVAGVALINTTHTAEIGLWSGQRMAVARKRMFRALDRALSHRSAERFRLRMTDLALLATRLGFGAGASPTHVAVTWRMIDGVPRETEGAAMSLLGEFDSRLTLPDIDVPVLVVAGSRDILTPRFLSEEIVARVPDGELLVLDGCGHMAPFERHADVSAYLRKFATAVLG